MYYIYMYIFLNKPPKPVLGVRIGAHYTLLGAAMKVTEIAHFSFGNSLINHSKN